MDAYDDLWKRYRRLKLAFVFSNLGILGVAALAFISAHRQSSNFAFFISGTAWFVWYSISYERFRRFPCPRCGHYFSSSWRAYLRTSARKCLHCGLERFALASQPAWREEPQ